MKVELKVVNLTKSKIMQMEYMRFPSSDVDVLGWVVIGKEKYSICKDSIGRHFRGIILNEVIKEDKGVQFPDGNGGWEFPILTNIKVANHKGAVIDFVAKRDNSENILLYKRLVSYMQKCQIAGQIYY